MISHTPMMHARGIAAGMATVMCSTAYLSKRAHIPCITVCQHLLAVLLGGGEAGQGVICSNCMTSIAGVQVSSAAEKEQPWFVNIFNVVSLS